MKRTVLICRITLAAGNNNQHESSTTTADTAKTGPETTQVKKEPKPPAKTYSNDRFRNVTVERIGDNEFLIRGECQIFEATLSWVVEDGHQELKKGFQTADAGAPAWGKFEFKINVEKTRENSTLTLVLFEISAKDGSRQHELPIPLY